MTTQNEVFGRAHREPEAHDAPAWWFKGKSRLPGVFVFKDVCVESLRNPVVRFEGMFEETKEIVVYDDSKWTHEAIKIGGRLSRTKVSFIHIFIQPNLFNIIRYKPCIVHCISKRGKKGRLKIDDDNNYMKTLMV